MKNLQINDSQIFSKKEAEDLILDHLFLEKWDDLYHFCPWATIFQSKEFVLSWYESFADYPKIIITDWNGQTMTGLITLTKKNNILTAAGLDMAEYQAWLSLTNSTEEFLKNAINAINIAFPKQTLYLKYLTSKVPLNLFNRGGIFYNRSFVRNYIHPLMATNVEVLESELKKKNKKEKINRLKRLGNLEFFEVKDIERFSSLIDEMALQSDFRKGAFYNKTFFHDEPERKTFLLKLFDLGLIHVSGMSVDGKLIASNAGIIGEDMVHLQGINSHSPFYSKYSPGILQFLMLGIELKKSGFKYFDLTPGGADGYKSMLATETSLAYEFWYTSKTEANKLKSLERFKNWLKPRLENKRFWGIDLSNMNTAGMKLKLKLRFSLKKLKNRGKVEDVHFLETESTYVPFREKEENIMPIESLGEGYIIKQNEISDLFLFDESSSLYPRMDIFADCIVRLEYGQTMYTVTRNQDLMAVYWYVPNNAKASKMESKESTRPPILAVSYYKDLKAKELLYFFLKIKKDFLDLSMENLSLEIGRKQMTLLKVFEK